MKAHAMHSEERLRNCFCWWSTYLQNDVTALISNADNNEYVMLSHFGSKSEHIPSHTPTHTNTWTLVLWNKNQRVWIDTCCDPALPGVWSFQKSWQGQSVLQEQSGQRGSFQLLGSGSWRLALGVNRLGHRFTASLPDPSQKRLPSVTAWSHAIPCASNGNQAVAGWPGSGSPSGPVLVPPSLQDGLSSGSAHWLTTQSHELQCL